MRTHRRRPPFLTRNRRARKGALLALRHALADAAPVLGGAFVTRDILDGHNDWVDAELLSKRPGRFYNAVFETAWSQVAGSVFDAAWEAANAKVPIDALDEILNPPDPERRARREEAEARAFDGLSRYAWVCAEAQRRASEAPLPPVVCGWRQDFGYHHGIGLIVTLRVPAITRAVIECFVHTFRSLDEPHRHTLWKGVIGPDEILRFGPTANAIASLSEWPEDLRDPAKNTGIAPSTAHEAPPRP